MLSYEPLMKTLQKRQMNVSDLLKLINPSKCSTGYVFKDFQGTKRISKICKILNCNIEDVVCWTKEVKQLEKPNKIFRPNTYNVNWDKLYKIIKEKKMTVTSVSVAMGKSPNFLSIEKKQKCRFYKETTDLICKTVGCNIEDFCDEV